MLARSTAIFWRSTSSSASFDTSERASSATHLWVPRTSSTSRDQAIFVDQATDASVSSDAVLLKIDWFG
jgi:hypothetical protein